MGIKLGQVHKCLTVGGCWNDISLFRRHSRDASIPRTKATVSKDWRQCINKHRNNEVFWFLVLPTSKTHWATRFFQLLLSSAASSTLSQLMSIIRRSFLTTSFQFCRGRPGLSWNPRVPMWELVAKVYGDPFVKDAQAISDVCIR